MRIGDEPCIACNGGALPCKGGGNLRCWRRDPQPSRCAGIIDTYGSIRFIVTHRKGLKHHVRADEISIVVPGLIVHEPIAWSDIPGLIRRIELAVDDWLARGLPNEPHAREAAVMHKLRRQEHQQQSLDLSAICET
jgi:hypothetical protein